MGNINWLASYPKSGNTWLRILLINLLYPTGAPVVNRVESIRNAADRSLFEEYAGLDPSDLTNNEIKELRPKVFEAISKSKNGPIFLKTHDQLINSKIKSSFITKEATSSCIYLVRNPLDIAVSYAAFKNVSINEIIEEMNNEENMLSPNTTRQFSMSLPQFLSSWSTHVTSWQEQKEFPMLVIRYEDLIQNTVLKFKEVVEFLNLDYSINDIKVAVKRSQFSTIQQQEKDLGFKGRFNERSMFFRKGVTGEGLKVLSKNQIEKIKQHHSEVMFNFGYC